MRTRTGYAGRPKTQPEINRFRRASLIEAALRVVAKDGIESATIAKIGAAAKVSRGLSAHYFASKEDLLVAAFEKLLEDVGAATSRSAHEIHGSPTRKLKAIVTTIFSDDVYDEVSRRAYLAFWTASLTNARLMKINRAAYTRFHTAVSGLFERAGEENGVELDARAAAISLIGLSDGLWLDLAIGVRGFSRADATALCCSHVDQLLGRNGRIPGSARKNGAGK